MTADAIAKKNELIALSLLRRILYFNFHMVPPAYSRYLQSLMLEGSEPLEGLSKLYHELQQSVGWARYAEDDMGKACEMMEKEDLEGFEGVRNKVYEGKLRRRVGRRRFFIPPTSSTLRHSD